MKVHVLGSTGMLGSYITKYLTICGYQVVPYTRSTMNVFDFDPQLFAKNIVDSDVVINCIGLLKPNIKSYEHAIIVNKNFPLILDLLSSKVGFKLVNFSSDCVFSGSKGDYVETDECDALDFYGLTKRHNYLSSTVMRLSFVGEERYNKIGLLEFAIKNKNKTVNGYTNCYWNGVTALEVAKTIDKLLQKSEISLWSGVRHIFSNKKVTKYELLSLIDKVYNLNLNIIPVQAAEISKTLIHNTLDRSLSTIYNRIEVPSLEQMIYEQRDFIL